MDKKKVVIGMSGGVDSSVAAALLLKKGYDVVGVTMQIWPDKDECKVEVEGGCCSLSAVDDARKVAYKLGIPYYVLNFKDVFEEKVINNFISEYQKGRTPNPCIVCNKYIKFDSLLKKSIGLGADYVATGHYAKIEYDENIGRYLLKRSAGGKKDQTYFLYSFTQYQLEHTLMPLYNITKEEVRKIASELELTVAQKKESQDICFVEDNDHGKFLEGKLGSSIKPGEFVDTNGNVIGKHKGIVHYTIGQRKGLGLSLKEKGYVIDIDPETNKVVIGENDKLFSNALIADDLNLISIESLETEMKVTAKIRYAAKEAAAVMKPIGNGRVQVIFEDMQRAITPGQAVVFYDGDVVVGGGTICR
jgi:tRNA-specific 2-thiouridylase